MPRKSLGRDVARARRLRRSLSLPERMLWLRIRGSALHLRKQHPLGDYVLDFYCAAARLAIEVDGEVHGYGDRPHRDEIRTRWLNAKGIEVIRVPAREVLADPDSVANGLLRLCCERATPLHHPALPDGPPPHPRSAGTGRSE